MTPVEQRRAELQLLLSKAIAEPIGLRVFSDAPERLRNELYIARREMLDPQADALQFRLVNLAGANLIITKLAPKDMPSPKGSLEDELGL